MPKKIFGWMGIIRKSCGDLQSKKNSEFSTCGEMKKKDIRHHYWVDIEVEKSFDIDSRGRNCVRRVGRGINEEASFYDVISIFPLGQKKNMKKSN